MFLGRRAFTGSARYALMTAGTAALAAAVMYVVLDVAQRDAQPYAQNKAAN